MKKQKPTQRKKAEEGPKRLYRSNTDKKIAGVCGGIAKFFNIDPTIIRLLWVFSIVIFGAGVLAYIILWIIIPKNPDLNQ